MKSRLRIGMHTSRSGSLENAAIRAQEVGANTFQIFSSSPRMWKVSAPDPADVARFQAVRVRFDLTPLVIHTNYLLNLATIDPVIRERSIASFRGEMQRAALIGAEYLVVHPGNYKTHTLEEGIAAFALGLGEALDGVDCAGVTVLIENTVGSGAQLGGRFEELKILRDLSIQETRAPIGFCLDTCHLLASGFDITTAEGLKLTLRHADTLLDLTRVHVIHANDSKGALGSHIDRHANIGEGNIGSEAFRRILTHPALRTKPFILETPVDEEGDDLRNIQMLQKLAQKK